jgi:hypothetical protein
VHVFWVMTEELDVLEGKSASGRIAYHDARKEHPITALCSSCRICSGRAMGLIVSMVMRGQRLRSSTGRSSSSSTTRLIARWR